ncbi:hypothetical protein [Liquorilactobacillus aquaticus]|nr:hypothetical protein [Liquorilactobacillus aquaticus]
MNINILLFQFFEPLDGFGPAEVFEHTVGFEVRYFSLANQQIKTYNK